MSNSITIACEADEDPFQAYWGDLSQDKFDHALKYMHSASRWVRSHGAASGSSFATLQDGDHPEVVFEAASHEAASTLSNIFEAFLGTADSVS